MGDAPVSLNYKLVTHETGNYFYVSQKGGGEIDWPLAGERYITRDEIEAAERVQAIKFTILAIIALDGGEILGGEMLFGRSAFCAAEEVAVTAYRVEGLPNTRIIIGEGGQVSVQGDQMLFVNFGSKARAEQFLATRLQQGMPGAQMKSFQVPQSFLTDLQEAAVPESLAKQFPGRPLLVDPTKAPNQFGLRPEQIKALQSAIIQGTGKAH